MPATAATRVHFLDVGPREYGDCVLCQIDGRSVLIDGAHPGDQIGKLGHPSIPEQLRSLLAAPETTKVDLLVVTHAHQDHIGCLPYLIEHGLLEAEWALVTDPGLGWGRPAATEGGADAPAPLPSLVAALREEPRNPASDDFELTQFIADAATLEQQYLQMLETLAVSGTKVIRFGRDDPTPLLEAFIGTGLEILGPSEAQLLACAEAIGSATDALSDQVGGMADAGNSAAAYRQLVGGGGLADAAGQRPGPAINLQSMVIKFESEAGRFLFGGDMQFADPQLGDETIASEVRDLRGRIKELAPFAIAKVSHHGSDNALDASVLEELGETPYLGICAGEESAVHPNPATLHLLEGARDHLQWARTDRNGLVTFEFNGETSVAVSRGELSDPRPNSADVQPGSGASQLAAPEPATAVVVATAPAQNEPVEIVTKIPPGVERVSLEIRVAPGNRVYGDVADGPGETELSELTLATGRSLPRLLFVTCADQLAANVGDGEARKAMDAIRAAGQPLFDGLRRGSAVAEAVDAVRGELIKTPDAQGVVVMGGYDVVPSLRLDVLPPQLRAALPPDGDLDDFIVWSDDGYGDLDGDGVAELPVSRIPEAKSAGLLFAALRGGGQPQPQPRIGVRNSARPFAEPIYAALPGTEPLAVSAPATLQSSPALGAERVYLMLHGDFADSTLFWGEDSAHGFPEAVGLSNIPESAGGVVLAGCCWGALSVTQRAMDLGPGATPAPKVADASIALTFLRRGAQAFVGCTGSHYSPVEEPYDYFGGPMHRAFWEQLAQDGSAAAALFRAKQHFVAGFPHGRDPGPQTAVEYKTLRQFTCLGLGW